MSSFTHPPRPLPDGPAVDRDTWLAVTAAAGAAPSIHNTQPWRFVVRPDVAELHLDPARVLPVADPDGREARISCGAALFNLRVALRAAGVVSTVALLPDRSHPTLLATVRPARRVSPSGPELALHAAIPLRRSHRRPFHPAPIADRALHDLVYAAGKEGAFLRLLTSGADVGTVASLVRRAHEEQRYDPAYGHELAAWTFDDDVDSERVDGVPRTTSGPRHERDGLLSVRDFAPSRTRPERPYEQDPLFAILLSARDTPIDHLRCGQALQSALLTATSFGVGASILSAPVERPRIRAAVREVLGGVMCPQLVLRLGTAHPAAGSPRRPPSDTTVLEGASDSGRHDRLNDTGLPW